MTRKNAEPSLFAQFHIRDREMVMGNREAHQRFGLVRIEVIEDNDMGLVRMEIHYGGNMVSKVHRFPWGGSAVLLLDP